MIKRSPLQIAEQRLAARLERHMKKIRGNAKVNPYDGITAIACEALGLSYRGIPAPYTMADVVHLCNMGDRRKLPRSIPISHEILNT